MKFLALVITFLRSGKLIDCIILGIAMEISMLLLAIFFLGSVVSFRLILAGLEDSLSGQWFTSNGSVISVDRLSGLAEAFGEGSAEGT